MKHLSNACWESRAVLRCLQTMHLFTVFQVSLCLIHFSHSNGSIQYKKCKERLMVPFFPPQWGQTCTMIPWELPGTGEQCLYCMTSIDILHHIGVFVLVNNCFLCRNSSHSSITPCFVLEWRHGLWDITSEKEAKFTGVRQEKETQITVGGKTWNSYLRDWSLSKTPW